MLYLAKGLGTLSDEQKADIAREFEEASVEVLTKKTLRALEEFGAKTVILGGGVSANKRLRKTLKEMIDAYDSTVTLYLPDHDDHELSTDNALMIAVAAYFGHAAEHPNDLRAKGNWKLSENKKN